ncbi:MAG: hypothetical protein ACLFU0_09525 [Alphaproteobacteria bacterium]
MPAFVCRRFALVVPLSAALAVPAAAQTTSLELELNKLEAVDDGCRAFFVVRNDGDTAFESLDLDVVTFEPDGVVAARFQVELGPVAADKTMVKPFDFADVACEDIDRVLLNDVVACAPPEPAECLAMIEPTSLAAEFFK